VRGLPLRDAEWKAKALAKLESRLHPFKREFDSFEEKLTRVEGS
jgi:hypothetical protein